MSYYGETGNRLIGQSGVTRALYETILTAHSEIAGERVYRDIANTNDKDDPATLTSDGYDGMARRFINSISSNVFKLNKLTSKSI